MSSSDGPQGEPARLTSARAHRVVVDACRAVGLDSDGARLIRLGENALFRLEQHPVIVRIARSTEYLECARLEVRVSRWLEATGMHAARVLDDVEQALQVSGHPVTFWHLEEYAEFVGAYGRDLRDWHGFPTLRAIQEFKMTTWLMQNIGESEEIAAEYARRVASLRDDEAPRNWQPG
jgi:hypothetical protein